MKKPLLQSSHIPVFIYPLGPHQPRAVVCTSCSQVSVSSPRHAGYIHLVAQFPKSHLFILYRNLPWLSSIVPLLRPFPHGNRHSTGIYIFYFIGDASLSSAPNKVTGYYVNKYMLCVHRCAYLFPFSILILNQSVHPPLNTDNNKVPPHNCNWVFSLFWTILTGDGCENPSRAIVSEILRPASLPPKKKHVDHIQSHFHPFSFTYLNAQSCFHADQLFAAKAVEHCSFQSSPGMYVHRHFCMRQALKFIPLLPCKPEQYRCLMRCFGSCFASQTFLPEDPAITPISHPLMYNTWGHFQLGSFNQAN